MKKMSIYEPAMCCPTGLCGIGVDRELLRISTVLNSLKKNGVDIERFNLTNAPMKFISNKAINQLINDKGIDELPVTVVDGDIIITGRYPTNDEIIELLNIPLNFIDDQTKAVQHDK